MPDQSLVCIDPGHGGRFSGAEGTNHLEKDLNLALALKLRSELEQHLRTAMTRDADIDLGEKSVSPTTALYQDLRRRCAICNDAGADLFISIHHNSLRLPSANGFEVLHWYTSANGKRLAESISSSFDPVGERFAVRNRGVKPRRNLYVLGHTQPPAVIVEAGFISNPAEEAIVILEEYRNALASALSSAVRQYLRGRIALLPS
jgi:N-acetylmuramoyl-L-alanine amidase